MNTDQLTRLEQRITALEEHAHNHKHTFLDQSQPLTFPLLYVGHVNGDGTADFLPNGWTSAKTATGIYKITHNLNLTGYGVVTVVDISGSFDTAYTSNVLTMNANDFKVDVVFVGGGAYSDTDKKFYFILMIRPQTN